MMVNSMRFSRLGWIFSGVIVLVLVCGAVKTPLEYETDDAVVIEAATREARLVPQEEDDNEVPRRSKRHILEELSPEDERVDRLIRRKRQFGGWPGVLPIGPCFTSKGVFGHCTSFRKCYPYFKLPDLNNWETWILGMYDTCSYFTTTGRQMFGVCCSNPGVPPPPQQPPTMPAPVPEEVYQPQPPQSPQQPFPAGPPTTTPAPTTARPRPVKSEPLIPPNWPPPLPTHGPDNTIPPIPTHPPSPGRPGIDTATEPTPVKPPPPVVNPWPQPQPPPPAVNPWPQPQPPPPAVNPWPQPHPPQQPVNPWPHPQPPQQPINPWPPANPPAAPAPPVAPPLPVWPPPLPTHPPMVWPPVQAEGTTKPPPATPAVPDEQGGGATLGDASCGAKNGYQDQERIVGGQNADLGEWPWIAALFNGARQFCGGSLIDSTHILTAAHCVAHMSSWDVARLSVKLGDHNIKTTTEVRHVEKKVQRVVRHKGFDARTLYNDVAILTLDSPVAYTRSIKPICLPTGSALYNGQTATVIGWGSLREGGQQPSVLQEVNIPIWTNAECKAKYGPAAPGGIVEHFLCAGQAGRDSCSGDSGGPLTINNGRWTQVGIVSWGIGCGKGQYPGVYTRVTAFMPWITKNLK